MYKLGYWVVVIFFAIDLCLVYYDVQHAVGILSS